MAKCLPLLCEVVIVWLLCVASSERLYWLGEELCTPKLYLPKILSRDFLCGNSYVDELVKILLCEGGDVELVDRTSKHILVFAFDPFSLTLSLTIDSYCSFILICLVLLFVFHTCVKPRELHIAP